MTATSFKPDWRKAYTCLAIRLGLVLAFSLTLAPQLRLFEANICRKYYREHNLIVVNKYNDSVPEALCKIAEVQQNVSNLMGLVNGVTVVPALLAAFPYLVLHRVIDRKKLLIVNLSGILLTNIYSYSVLYFYNTFDPTWICLMRLFNFIGGGDPVLGSIVNVLVAESVPPRSLSSFQLRYTAMMLIVHLAGSATALSMMQRSIWVPILLAFAIYVLTIIVACVFLKESSSPKSKDVVKRNSRLVSRNEGKNDCDVEARALDSGNPRAKLEDQLSLAGNRKAIKRLVVHIWHILVNCRIAVAIFFCHGVGESVRAIGPYWMSRRYQWQIRDVGWVQLGESLFTAVLVALLPHLGTRYFSEEPLGLSEATPEHRSLSHTELDDRKGSSNGSTTCNNQSEQLTYCRRDLGLARLCILLSALGAFLLGLSWYRISVCVSLAVMAGGMGFYGAFYSYLASQFTAATSGPAKVNGSNDLTTLYMVLSMVTITAESLGGLVVSRIYSASLGVHGDKEQQLLATSLPIWFCMAAYLVTWLFSRRAKHS